MAKTVFDMMTFPPYAYQEYPKWVLDASGAEVLVHTEAEEHDLAASTETTEQVEEPAPKARGRRAQA